MTAPKGTHTVTFDHSRCDHNTADDYGMFACDPTAEYACIAQPGDYCRFGCIEDPCSETGWVPSLVSPGECFRGHLLVAHECWVLPWLDAVDISETYADIDTVPEGFVFHDGPIDIMDWDEDYLVWAYSKATP